MRFLLLTALLACDAAPDPAPEAPPITTRPAAPAAAAPHGSAAPHGAAPTAPPHGAAPTHGSKAPEQATAGAAWQGKALEVLEGGGYTYVKLQIDDEWIWIAGPQSAVAVGDQVVAPKGSPMKDFRSPTLDRTFPSIDFVRAIQVAGAPAQVAAAPAKAPSGNTSASVEKLADGLTVAEVWTDREQLGGKPVALRGRVVKYSAGILNTNFMHIQDGSGDAAAGTHDITVTTQGAASVGDIVVVRGTVVLNKDYGMGYSYPVLLDEASLTVE